MLEASFNIKSAFFDQYYESVHLLFCLFYPSQIWYCASRAIFKFYTTHENEINENKNTQHNWTHSKSTNIQTIHVRTVLLDTVQHNQPKHTNNKNQLHYIPFIITICIHSVSFLCSHWCYIIIFWCISIRSLLLPLPSKGIKHMYQCFLNGFTISDGRVGSIQIQRIITITICFTTIASNWQK